MTFMAVPTVAVKASSNNVLLSVYNKCVDAVQTFRMYHIQIVAK